MKVFKRILILLCIVVMAVSAVAFVGCEEKEGEALSGSMKIVITPDKQTEATVIDVDLKDFTSADKVSDVIESLTKAGKLCYKGQNGAYGLYLTAIGVPVEKTDDEGKTYMEDNYILESDESKGLYTFTSVDEDKLETKPDYTPMTVEYEGMTLTEPMYGFSYMNICDGAVIYITYTIW